MTAISAGLSADGLVRTAAGTATLPDVVKQGRLFDGLEHGVFDPQVACDGHAVDPDPLAVPQDVGRALLDQRQQRLCVVEPERALCGEEVPDLADAIAHLLREPRVPLHFLDRLAPPLPAAVEREHEAVAPERFDEQVGDRSVGGGRVDELRVAGREHDRGIRVIAADLSGEPEAVLAGHHDVDHREIGVALAE